MCALQVHDAGMQLLHTTAHTQTQEMFPPMLYFISLNVFKQAYRGHIIYYSFANGQVN